MRSVIGWQHRHQCQAQCLEAAWASLHCGQRPGRCTRPGTSPAIGRAKAGSTLLLLPPPTPQDTGRVEGLGALEPHNHCSQPPQSGQTRGLGPFASQVGAGNQPRPPKQPQPAPEGGQGRGGESHGHRNVAAQLSQDREARPWDGRGSPQMPGQGGTRRVRPLVPQTLGQVKCISGSQRHSQHWPRGVVSRHCQGPPGREVDRGICLAPEMFPAQPRVPVLVWRCSHSPRGGMHPLR